MQSKEVKKEKLDDGSVVTTETTLVQKQETLKSNDAKADKYESIFDKHDKLDVTIGNSKEKSNLTLSKKSWAKIIKIMPEEKNYALNYVVFSLTQTSTVVKTMERKTTKKREETDGYFKRKLPTDNKLKLHCNLNKKEFDIFDKYFKSRINGPKEEEKPVEEPKKEEPAMEEPKKEKTKKEKPKKEEPKKAEEKKVEEIKIKEEESEPKPEEPKTKLRSKNQKPNRPGKNESKKEEDEKEEKPSNNKVPEKKVEQEIPIHYVKSISNAPVQFAHKWRNHPREYGKDSRYCRVCRNTHGLIRKYDIEMCRRCFRERYALIGFKQTK